MSHVCSLQACLLCIDAVSVSLFIIIIINLKVRANLRADRKTVVQAYEVKGIPVK